MRKGLAAFANVSDLSALDNAVLLVSLMSVTYTSKSERFALTYHTFIADLHNLACIAFNTVNAGRPDFCT